MLTDVVGPGDVLGGRARQIDRRGGWPRRSRAYDSACQRPGWLNALDSHTTIVAHRRAWVCPKEADLRHEFAVMDGCGRAGDVRAMAQQSRACDTQSDPRRRARTHGARQPDRAQRGQQRGRRADRGRARGHDVLQPGRQAGPRSGRALPARHDGAVRAGRTAHRARCWTTCVTRRRIAIAGTMLARGLLCWGMAGAVLNKDPLTLMPAAFGALVLSKAFGVSRSAVTPRVLPEGLGLVTGERPRVFLRSGRRVDRRAARRRAGRTHQRGLGAAARHARVHRRAASSAYGCRPTWTPPRPAPGTEPAARRRARAGPYGAAAGGPCCASGRWSARRCAPTPRCARSPGS